MDQGKVRVGLIGYGRIAQWFHLGNLLHHPRVELVAIAETDEATLSRAARLAPGAEAMRDYGDLLVKPELDAVVICVPTHLHADVAEQAFARGRHVYVEKPLAASRKEAERVMHAWRASGRVGMVNFNARFHPLVVQAKSVLAEGRIGRIVSIGMVQSSAACELPTWKQSRDTGGGVLLDMASHQFDLLPYLLGCRVTQVQASTWSHRAQDDTAMVRVQTDTGLWAQMFLSNSAAQQHRIEVHGDDGALIIDRFESTLRVLPRQPRADRLGMAQNVFESLGDVTRRLGRMFVPQRDPSYRLALDAFIKAVIKDDVQDGSNMLGGCTSLESVLAAEESARTQLWVRLKDTDSDTGRRANTSCVS